MSDLINNIPISEIVAKTKHLEIKARKMVNSSLQNDYKSSFRGRGMEFDEVRPYILGDNVRDIDWNVTAKMNEPFVKIFMEERELLTYFIVDISASGNFGSTMSKRDVMTEITALLSFAAFFSNDKTGLILATNRIEKSIPPAHNYSNVLRIIRDTAYYKAASRYTNLDTVFRNAYNLIKKRAIIFVLSDFLDEGYKNSLGSLSRKHEVIPIVVRDKVESNFMIPSMFPILTEVEDMETGECSTITLNSRSVAKKQGFLLHHKTIFRQLGLEYAEIDSSTDYVKVIDRLLRCHAKRK